MNREVIGRYLSALLLVLGAGTCVVVADDPNGSFSMLLGKRTLDDFWEPVDDHLAYGVAFSFNRGEWPVQVAFDVMRTEDDTTENGSKVEGETLEVAVGVRKFWGRRVRPYIGGGLCLTRAEFSTASTGGDDDGAGVWVNAGLLWRVTRRFNLGLDVRVSRVDATPLLTEQEVGGDQIGLLIGTGW